MNWILICRGAAAILAMAAGLVLDIRELAGVALLLLSIIVYEKAKSLQWLANEESKRIDAAARYVERTANMNAVLKARTPGQGRNKP